MTETIAKEIAHVHSIDSEKTVTQTLENIF